MVPLIVLVGVAGAQVGLETVERAAAA